MGFYARYGIQIALAVIAYTLLLYVTGIANSAGPERLLASFSMVFPIVGIAWGLRAWRDQIGGGYLSLGRGIQVGVFIVMWWAVPATAFQVLYSTVINPGGIQAMFAAEVAKLEASGATPEMLAMMEKVMAIMLHPAVQVVMGLFGTMFWGMIIVLIAAALLKREPPPAPLVPPPLPGS